MVEPLGRAETRELLDRHGIRLRSSLGQNFLVEPNIVRRIVELAGVGEGSSVVEVGAGAGTLTRALTATGAKVIAYEVDERLRPVIAETVGDRAEIRFEDAAAVDFEHALPPGEWVMVANLPYNVGTPIVLSLLRAVPRMVRFVVMLQLEAVERLAAGPGSRVYGLPSVVAGLHSSVQLALRVPGHLFVPPTPVESGVVVLDRIEPSPLAERAVALAAAGFGKRRKMLRASLRSALDQPEAALVAAGVDPTARAEDLSAQQWLAVAGAA